MLVLHVIQGPDKGRRFELPDHEPQLIGRSSEALPLSDSTISRRHAELTPDDGRWLLRDLESSNGTYLNGKRVDGRSTLSSGDQIRTGATLFVFGRSAHKPLRNVVRVMEPEHIESSVEASAPSNEDSLIMAVPDPSAAAQMHLKVMYDLMQMIGTVFDQEVLLERILELVFNHFEPDRGVILLREHDEDEPEPVAVRYRHKVKSQESIAISRTIVHHVLNKSEGVLSSNAMTDQRFSSGDSVQAYGIHSAICVPLKAHDRMRGVLYIDSKVANYTFTEDQTRLLTAIGMLVGLALENVELYHKGMATARLAAVGETVASLSHSIRNMMQAIRGGSEVVELGLRKNDLGLVRNGWDILARNLDRVFELTMNMLAFSKQRRPEFELISLPNLMQEVVELMRPQCERRNVKLVSEVDTGMPPVPADGGGLHQAITNLLNNALDAVQTETGVIRLRCSYDPKLHVASLSVNDNGCGINPESTRKLFQPFYSTKGLRGTGLGLVVTKKIIEEHGGKISVQSKLNVGTTFTLNFSTLCKGDPAATH